MTDPTQPSPSTGAAPHAEPGSAQKARHHVRPSRRGGEARLPLAVRKELLLTRAALERYDYMHARNDLHRATSRTFSPVSYTHLTLPTKEDECRSRWSPYH